MPIQWKLLIVLLTVALPPLLIISFFDQQAARQLGSELAHMRAEAADKRAGDELVQAARDHVMVIARQRRVLQTALEVVAKDVRGGREGAPLTLPSALDAGDFRSLSVLLANGQTIRLWPTVGEEAATQTVPQDWQLKAAASNRPVLAVRPPTKEGGIATFGGVMAARDADGRLRGIIAADFSFASVLKDIQVSINRINGASALLGYLDPETKILSPMIKGTASEFSALLTAMPEDMTAGLRGGRNGLSSVTMGGEVHKVAYVQVGEDGILLFLTLPVSAIVTERTEAEIRIDQRIEQQVMIGAMSVILLLSAAVILALIGARSITRPVKALTAVARRIAGGDLNARCRIQTGDELEELATSFNEMMPKLNDRIKMREALSLAMEVQQKLLPNEAPDIKGFDIAGRSIYCDETGGDYYDFLDLTQLNKQQVGIAVGDVTGHGIAAALLMAAARALLRSHADEPGDLSQLMNNINRHLASDAHAGRFMTLFYSVINATKREMRWVSAGHPPALLYTPKSDAFTELDGPDIPLGIDGNWDYQEMRRVGWEAGEILAIGTDGIWEMRNPEGVMFGVEAMHEIIRENADKRAEDICLAVTENLVEHRAERDQEDDVTLVIVKFVE